jgi:tetratricopeptide (TPR) repeat protein
MTSGLSRNLTLVKIVALLSITGVVGATPAFAQSDLVNQARRLDLEGKQEAAIALYRQALTRAPDSFEAHYGIARALDLVDRYDEARQHFAKAIGLAPEGVKDQALRMMAISYTFTGNQNEAAKYFRQVFDRRSQTGNYAGAAEVANELGRVYLELGNPTEAYRWYRAGYEADARQTNRPTSEIALSEFRWAHAQSRIAARRGDRREALRQAATAKMLLEKGSNRDQQIQYPYLLGYVHLALKEFKAAIEQLSQADQQDPFILVLLGESYDRLGNAATAREYYEKALKSTSHAVNNAFARRIALGKTAR